MTSWQQTAVPGGPWAPVSHGVWADRDRRGHCSPWFAASWPTPANSSECSCVLKTPALGPTPPATTSTCPQSSCRKTSEPSLLPPLIPAGLCCPHPSHHHSTWPAAPSSVPASDTHHLMCSVPHLTLHHLPACSPLSLLWRCVTPDLSTWGVPASVPGPCPHKCPNLHQPVLVFSPKSQLQCSGLFLPPV